MQFRIASTFTDSLTKLTANEQTAVKTTVFDLQANPDLGGLRLHPVQGTRDRDFWSARVNQDVRIIVHRQAGNTTLCYVDHHDDAYSWATRRRMEVHPHTGAMQLVELRETVREIEVPVYVEVERPAPPRPRPAARIPHDQLLSYGVPVEWMESVREADQDALLEIAGHLPEEAAEALLLIATGETPRAPLPAQSAADPFDHPDALRRFRVMRDIEELGQALEYPWEKWSVFLHPAQQELVERDYSGPARVSGSAGTGKTVVALHRAVFLARSNPDARVLLGTFSDTLASALHSKLRVLISNEPRLAERLEVHSIDAIARRLYRTIYGPPKLASNDMIRELIEDAIRAAGDIRFSLRFLMAEWEQVLDAWGLETWEAYRDVPRLGRRRRLAEGQRRTLWALFQRVREGLVDEGLITHSDLYRRLAEEIEERARPTFDFVVIDESQDVNIGQLLFLAALGAGRPNGLFFGGDLGQRIFQQPFSWRALGVDIRGRSRTLRINYRTSHQIRTQADLLLDPELSDVDGNTEDRRGTVSVFNGPSPAVQLVETEADEIDRVAEWITRVSGEGLMPHEISVFVRSDSEMNRALEAVESSGLPSLVLKGDAQTQAGHVSVGTMYLAKGLEFRGVAVMACDDDVIPSEERIEQIEDESDLEDAYNTERHLLYVACTRARDHLLVTGVQPGSEFLADLNM